MLVRGCWAAANSATAGAGAAALEEAVLVLAVGLAVDDVAGEEDPHPAMTRATTGVRRRAEENLMALMMTAPTG
jgi:hypothetical protein